MQIQNIMITNIYFDWGDTLAYPHMKNQFIKNKNANGVLYPDVLDILQYLHKKYKIGIITNSKHSKKGFIDALKKSNLIQYFSGAIVFSNETCKKPCKSIFLQALQKDNIIPCNAIMIGNEYQNDIIGARKCGINTLYVNRDGFGDISNLWELYYYL